MTRDETAPGWIAFDQVEIDLAGRRLFVAGAEAPLEPKAFAVLALLARNPGQALTRDEILDAVWGHRHVTPGVLNRVMSMLRQALGESADKSQYLHTLYGVGYRLDAQTQMLPARRLAGAPEGASAVAAHDHRVEAGTSTSPAPAPLPATPAAIEAAEAAPAAAPSAGNVMMPTANPTRTAARHLTWLGALLACVAIGAWYVLAGRTAPTPASAAPTLVVLPLRPVGTEHEEAVLADGLSEELITRLARVSGISLISITSASLASSQGLDRNQLATRLHVTHALEGSLRKTGSRLRIDLRLIELQSGRTLWARNYDRAVADVFAIESEIAQLVGAALALKLGLPAAAPEADPASYREYLRLRWHVRHFDVGSGPGPERDEFIARLRAFATRYPGYARAHGLLALGLVTRPFTAGPIPDAQIAEARGEAGLALELDPDEADALMTVAYVACTERDWERCLSGAHRLARIAPADALVRALYTYQLAKLGYLDQALEQAEIGVASDPLSYAANFQRARVLDTLGRHEQARKAFDAMEALPEYTPEKLSYARWFNAVWRHDFDAARRNARLMGGEFRDSYVAATEALVDPSRWSQVMPLLDASERAAGRSNFLHALQPDADIPAAIAMLEDVFRKETSTYMLLLWNPETANLRRDPAFQDFLQRNRILGYWNAHGLPPQCRREGDGAVCP